MNRFLLSSSLTLCLFISPLNAGKGEREKSPDQPTSNTVAHTPHIGTSMAPKPSSEYENEETDRFDWLLQKHPELASRDYSQSGEEKRHYVKLELLAKKMQKSPFEVLKGGAQMVLEYKLLPNIPAVGRQDILSQVALMRQDHPTHGYFKPFFERLFDPDHTVIENLTLASAYVYETVKGQGGGTVIFLGRTPCLLQLAYEEVLKSEGDSDQRAVHLNFSGHPDALTMRESTFFDSPEHVARCIVTPERLSHYFTYMNTMPLLNSKKLFIVDMIGSGSGLNSFLRILNGYYGHHSTKTPELAFFNITHDWNWKRLMSLEGTGKLNYSVVRSEKSSHQATLSLHADKRKNVHVFSFQAYGLPVHQWVVSEMLDQDMFQEFLVHGIEYPAQRWTSEHDEARAEGAIHHKEFYDWLRPQYTQLIEGYKKVKGSPEGE